MARAAALALVLFATAACGQQNGDPIGTKMLLDGARECDTQKVKTALKRGTWIEERDPECKHQDLCSLQPTLQRLRHVCLCPAVQQTALHLAAKAGCVSTVQTLLEERADPNARTHHDETALMEAADNGHDKVVQLLIKFEADVNARTNSGKTALHGAQHSDAQLYTQGHSDTHAVTLLLSISLCTRCTLLRCGCHRPRRYCAPVADCRSSIQADGLCVFVAAPSCLSVPMPVLLPATPLQL